VERLAALEQVCIAAYDLGDIDIAERCLMELEARLAMTAGSGGATGDNIPPMGMRYKLLLALRHESLYEYHEAIGIYTTMLRENPANSYAAKRKYCCVLATTSSSSSSSIEGAIQELNEYINDHPGDIAAWYQMSQHCLSLCDYTSAAYCLEEVILGSPLDSTLHCQLAELYCTLGGVEYSKLARKHMCMAIHIEPNNLRAWYGLLAVSESYLDEVHKLPMSSSSTGGSGGGGGGGSSRSKNKSNGNNNSGSRKDAENDSIEVAKELVKFSAEKLMRVYKDSPRMKVVIESMLKESSESL
jgi:tetratricopeptide (TPR) repeat protein